MKLDCLTQYYFLSSFDNSVNILVFGKDKKLHWDFVDGEYHQDIPLMSIHIDYVTKLINKEIEDEEFTRIIKINNLSWKLYVKK
jgi:hypothetical protein